VLGIVHGLHLAMNALYFDQHLWGLRTDFTIQWGAMELAIGFAVLCCLVASVIPAMRAGRTNILAALRHV
jgi:ABC-type lipoprotein release transport system permease subunit